MPDQATPTAVVQTRQQTAWNYAVVTIHARHNDVLEEGLKERGREGWELVFIHMPMANEYTCIFRRSE